MAIPAEYSAYAEQTARKYGVSPQLVQYVLNRESRGNPTAVSPAGALGLMQLMPTTGAALGLRGQDFFDPYKNIDTGVRYLSQLGRQFNNDPTAMMIGYNAGPRWAQRFTSGEIGANQLPHETQAYVAGFGQNRATPVVTQTAPTQSNYTFSPTMGGGAPAQASGIFAPLSLYGGGNSPSMGLTNGTGTNSGPSLFDPAASYGPAAPAIHASSSPFFAHRIGTYDPAYRTA